MRLIDADKLLNKRFLNGMIDGNELLVSYTDVVNAIRQAPTVDAVEVRHGEWKQASEKYPRYVCTSCNHLFNNKNYNYCPCCGAKMDGERRENEMCD